MGSCGWFFLVGGRGRTGKDDEQQQTPIGTHVDVGDVLPVCGGREKDRRATERSVGGESMAIIKWRIGCRVQVFFMTGGGGGGSPTQPRRGYPHTPGEGEGGPRDHCLGCNFGVPNGQKCAVKIGGNGRI